MATWLYITLYLVIPSIYSFGVDETGVQNSEWLSITWLLLEEGENNDTDVICYLLERGTSY